uniref:Acyltransferase n=1 Tax=Oryctolagus cuniculus TaxID=9986 RepID=A0A5F9CGB6_RABIT
MLLSHLSQFVVPSFFSSPLHTALVSSVPYLISIYPDRDTPSQAPPRDQPRRMDQDSQGQSQREPGHFRGSRHRHHPDHSMDSGRRNTCERMWSLQEDGGTRMADSTAPVHCHPMPSCKAKTLQKEWLEKLGALQFVLTLCSGGRRFVWPRTWAIWKHQRDYFPIKLVKTAELPPSQNYVQGSHSHGVMITGAFSNFHTESNDFSRLFPGLQPWTAMMAIFFYVPLFREYIMAGGLRPASRHSLDFVLSQPQRGQAVVIVPGGAQEALYTAQRRHRLELLNRKGFVRLALRHGSAGFSSKVHLEGNPWA